MASRRTPGSTESYGFDNSSWDTTGANWYAPEGLELQNNFGAGGNTGYGAGIAPEGAGPRLEGPLPGPRPPNQPPANPVQRAAFDYEGGRDAWMSGKYGLTEDGIRQWNDEFGLLRNYNGGDVGELANGGGLIDLLEAFKSGNPTRATWTAAGGNGPNGNGGGGGGQGGPGGPAGPGGGGKGGLFDPDVMDQLKKLFPDGAFNMDLTKRRTDVARDQLNSFSKSRNASNRAQLADRGLLGSGAEMTAQNSAESDIADKFSQAASSIYGDESQRADSRMMQALQMAAGLTESEAQMLIDQTLGNRKMDIERELGLGNIGVQRELGLGNLGLGWGRLNLDQNQGDIDALIKLLGQLYGGADTSAGGYY